MRPYVLTVLERQRVHELQLWMGMVKPCPTCHELRPLEVFEDDLHFYPKCEPCRFEDEYRRSRAWGEGSRQRRLRRQEAA
jgi:uncharacterized protein (DUF983 family)